MNWGIIGTGNIASKFAKTINQMNNEGERVIAVASRSQDKAESFAREYSINKAYSSYSDLFRDNNIEIVYIATPNNLHKEEIEEALLNSKHVLCEKPITLNPEDTISLYSLAKSKNLFLMEGLWTYFLPGAKELNRLISQGAIGKIKSVKLAYGFAPQGERRERKLLSKLGGGALLDIGIYNLGLISTLGLKDLSISSTRVKLNEYNTDSYSETNLIAANGALITSINAIDQEYERVCTIIGDKGKIVIPDFQHLTSFTVNDKDYSFPVEINGFEYEIRECRACISEGKTHSDIYSPDISIYLSQLIYRIRMLWNMKFDCE